MNESDLDNIIKNQPSSVGVEADLPSTSLAKQITIYFVSLLAPPFGLWWGFKYLRANNEKAKKIGIAAILLTIIALVLSFWIAKTFIDNLTQSFNEMDLYGL